MLTNASVNATRSSEELTWKHTWGLAVLGTILSIARQNFHFGLLNNVFHVPIVLKLFDLGQFSQDPFYQSLRSFTSLVWPTLSLVATPGNVAAVFLGAHIVSRFLLYIACIRCLIQIGVRSVVPLVASVLVLAAGSAFTGYSMIGATGLQIDYFTHTELTYPFVIFSLLLASRRRYAWAFAVNGVTFNVNAFVGMWLVVVLAMMALAEPVNIQKKVRTLLTGGIVQAVISLPTIAWILITIRDSQGAPSFDYRAFVAYYFPKHFLIQASSLPELVEFAMVCVSGLIALRLIGRAARPWGIAFLGCLVLFAAGSILPLVSSSRLLLNLLFLRIDGIVILLSLLLAARAAAPFLQREAGWGTAIAVFATLGLGDWRVTAIALSILAFEGGAIRTRAMVLLCAAAGALSIVSQLGMPATVLAQHLLVAALCFLLAFLEEQPVLLALGAVVASINFPILCAGAVMGLCGVLLWKRHAALLVLVSAGASTLGQVALQRVDLKTVLPSTIMLAGTVAVLASGTAASALRARFGGRTFTLAYSILLASLLVPLGQGAALAWVQEPRGTLAIQDKAWKEVQRWARSNTPADAVFLVPSDSEGFELGSYRLVWIDWQQGAAVMWSPSYYSRWMSRYPEVHQLKSHLDFNQYARAHNLQYYVIAKELSDCQACRGEVHVYGNSYFDVYRLTDLPAAI